jgi:Holliday junction resolvase
MPNKNYIKGRRKEYKICKKLREEGYEIVQRSAGSHSPVDVFAINKETKVVLLVQAKPDGYKEKKYEEYNWLNGKFTVKFEIR